MQWLSTSPGCERLKIPTTQRCHTLCDLVELIKSGKVVLGKRAKKVILRIRGEILNDTTKKCEDLQTTIETPLMVELHDISSKLLVVITLTNPKSFECCIQCCLILLMHLRKAMNSIRTGVRISEDPL